MQTAERNILNAKRIVCFANKLIATAISFILFAFRFISTAFRIIQSAERNMTTAIRNIASANRIIAIAKWNEKKKGRHITAVWQYGGFRLNLKLVLYLQSQCLTESLGFLNPPHRQAAGRWWIF